MTDSNQDTEIDYFFTNFQPTHLKGSEPKEKTIETGNAPIKFKNIFLQYNYGTDEKPIIDQCYYECPPIRTYGGINKQVDEKQGRDGNPYIKESYSMMFSFNIQDQESQQCLQKWDELFMATSHIMGQYKGKLNMFDYDPARPGSTYKNPMYYKRDQVSGERLAGHNPSLWVKLNNYSTNKSLFTDVNGEPIDWGLLYNVEATMIPLIHIEKIYVGTKPSLQLKLISAIITDIAPINSKSRQTRTLDKLKAKGGLADSVASQLASLRMDKQDELDNGNFQPTVARVPNGNNSSSGGGGQMHQMPQDDGLNDFLNGAPSIPQQTAQVQNQVQNQQPMFAMCWANTKLR